MHDVNKFERQNAGKLPKIYESVACPQAGCGAQSGDKCRNVSAGFGTIAQQAPRRDYHQIRKLVAIDQFLANTGAGAPASAQPQTKIFDSAPAPWRQ
jgi:hypothetical protein